MKRRDVMMGGELVACCPSSRRGLIVRIGLGEVQFFARWGQPDGSMQEQALGDPWPMPRAHGEWAEILRRVGECTHDILDVIGEEVDDRQAPH